ncbi:aromatic amino acid transaminase [Flavisphingomonas formosensis]|uniref:aromatic amino acid transaminase n=1 Tax=Flavisphingomonas formosensis TaxID=861534 RepID=UPI0012F8E536|nr:aromatic amino acid transaminase [Sphingomonas formosensis]
MYFATLSAEPRDPILAIIDAFASDRRTDKIDLGIGVYRDAEGGTPVMRVVKLAEQQLLAEQASKGYLGIEGDRHFVAALQPILFGTLPRALDIAGVQSVGGTGALRLAADLLALERRDRTVWFGLPTWANHLPLFAAAGLQTRTFRYVDPATQRVDGAALGDAVAQARQGDVIVVHGCCHNPTGIDLDLETWREIGVQCARKGLLPVVDMAYHGFGHGLDEDAAGLRALLEEVPAALIAYSCSKNFALYRERTGALFVVGSGLGVELAMSNLFALARANYSMPPDHGAAVVRTILQSPALARAWREELGEMRTRVRSLRAALAAHGRRGPVDLVPLGQQNGFFSSLPLDAGQIMHLREAHGIYIAPNGRINVAGLAETQLDRFAASLEELDSCVPA